jgi:hypothetical protein
LLCTHEYDFSHFSECIGPESTLKYTKLRILQNMHCGFLDIRRNIWTDTIICT